MATGDSPEMQRMQEEAVQRAREMQSRAQNPPDDEEEPKRPPKKVTGRSASGRGRAKTKPDEPLATPAESPDTPVEPPENEMQPDIPSIPMADPAPNLLDNLFKDKDHTLILMLLILIGGESENNELMFALLFLLM